MRIVNRLFGGPPPPDPPDWARFFDARGYLAFQEAVRRDLEQRGLEFQIAEDGGVIELLHNEDTYSLGLGNLAQICNQNPRWKWAGVVRDHFDRILNTTAQTDVLDALGADFETGRDCLKLRLFPADLAAQDSMIVRPLADGLIAAIVFDLPESVASVHRDQVASWGLSDDELFEIGLNNVRAEGRPRAMEMPAHDGAKLTLLSGDSFFVASHALLLPEYVAIDPELGALIAVPNRHALLYHPIVDFNALGALSAMIPAAYGMYQQGPGSISPYVYWWRDGEFQAQHAEITDQGIDFRPTDEFIFQVLNRIRPH